MSNVNKWLPSVVTVLCTALATVHAPEWIAAHPQYAAILAGVYAVVKGLMPSPVTDPK